MQGKKHLVFVYGTLMKGGRNPMPEGSRFIKEAVTKEASFIMIQFNSTSTNGKQTPGVLRKRASYIAGEVYEVDSDGMIELDKLEADGVIYKREKIMLQDNTTAWMYLLIADKRPSEQQDRVLYDQSTNTYSWDRQEPKPV